MLALGSCFAEHIGTRLLNRKFDLFLNPTGIIYNPVSVLQTLELLQRGDQIRSSDLFQYQELWHHFNFHGRYAHPDPEKALELMNTSISEVHKIWPQLDRLIITWGTAYAYRHLEQDRIVANCHKLPGKNFERFRLSLDQFLPDYVNILQQWKLQQPDLQVLISVSPVRHLRDGLVANQRSKAVLLLAAEQLCRELDFVHYFPAYELVLDDLRDYRFYDRDLAHPNETAVDYVWEYFQRSCLDDATRQIAQRVEPIMRAARHRPFHSATEAHRQFCRQQLEKINMLEAEYPFLDFALEKDHFSQAI